MRAKLRPLALPGGMAKSTRCISKLRASTMVKAAKVSGAISTSKPARVRQASIASAKAGSSSRTITLCMASLRLRGPSVAAALVLVIQPSGPRHGLLSPPAQIAEIVDHPLQIARSLEQAVERCPDRPIVVVALADRRLNLGEQFLYVEWFAHMRPADARQPLIHGGLAGH